MDVSSSTWFKWADGTPRGWHTAWLNSSQPQFANGTCGVFVVHSTSRLVPVCSGQTLDSCDLVTRVFVLGCFTGQGPSGWADAPCNSTTQALPVVCQAAVGAHTAQVSVAMPAAAGVSPPNAASGDTVSITVAPPLPTITLAVGQAARATSSPVQFAITFSSVVAAWRFASFSQIVDAGPLVVTPQLSGSGTTYHLSVTVDDASECSDPAGCLVRVALPHSITRPLNLASNSASVVYDVVPPTAKFITAPSANHASTAVLAMLGCTEPGCVFAYALDGGPWQPVTSDDGDTGQGSGSSNTTALGFDTAVVVWAGPGFVTSNFTCGFEFRLVHDTATPDESSQPVSAADADTRFLVSVDGGTQEVVASPHYTCGAGELGPGRHTLVVRASSASSGVTSAIVTSVEWRVISVREASTVHDATVAIVTQPPIGWCHAAGLSSAMVAVACSGDMPCAAHTTPSTATGEPAWSTKCRGAWGTSSSAAVAVPWLSTADGVECGNATHVAVSAVGPSGESDDAVLVPFTSVAPAPPLHVTVAPLGHVSAYMAPSPWSWRVVVGSTMLARAMGPGLRLLYRVVAAEHASNASHPDGGALAWSQVNVTSAFGGASPTSRATLQVPVAPPAMFGTTRTLQARLVATDTPCTGTISDVGSEAAEGPITSVSWTESKPSPPSLPVVWWHPLPEVPALSAAHDVFRWSGGPACVACNSEYRVLVVSDEDADEEAVPWTRVGPVDAHGLFEATVPREVAVRWSATVPTDVHLRFEVRMLAPGFANDGSMAWVAGDTSAVTWALLQVPPGVWLRVEQATTSLPSVAPGAHRPVAMPHHGAAFTWRAHELAPDTVFIEHALCRHGPERVADAVEVASCGVDDTGFVVAPSADNKWSTGAGEVLPAFPTNSTYTIWARARHVGGWRGQPVVTTWDVSDVLVDIVQKPPPVTPLASTTFEFSVVTPGLQQQLRTQPWLTWLEYRVWQATATQASSRGLLNDTTPWLRAGSEALVIGPVPPNVDLVLVVRARGAPCIDCWRHLSVGLGTDGAGSVNESHHVDATKPWYVGPASVWEWRVEPSANSTLALHGLPQGPHTLEIRAQDAAANAQVALPASVAFTVDTLPPNATVSLVQPSPFNDGDAQLAWLHALAPAGASEPQATPFVTNATHVAWRAHLYDRIDDASSAAAARYDACETCTLKYWVAGPASSVGALASHIPGSVDAWLTATPTSGGGVVRIDVARNESGWYQLHLAGMDAAGNVQERGTWQARSWLIDRAAPSVCCVDVAPPQPGTRLALAGTARAATNRTSVVVRMVSVDGDVAQFRVAATPVGEPSTSGAVTATIDARAYPDVQSEPMDVPGAAWVEVVGRGLIEQAPSSASFKSAQMTLGPLLHGLYTVTVTAVDALGNEDPAPLTWLLDIDNVAPTTAPPTVPRSPTNASSVDITLSASPPFEALMGFYVDVTFDAGASAPALVPRFVPVTGAEGDVSDDPAWRTAVLTLAPLTSGVYTITARAEDVAGNVDVAAGSGSAVLTLWVDQVAPESTVLQAPPPFWNSSAASFIVSGSEPGCSFVARVVGSDGNVSSGVGIALPEDTATTALVKVDGPLPDGVVTATLTSVDRAGNAEVGGGVTSTFVVDTRAPSSSVVVPLDISDGFTALYTWQLGANCTDRWACTLNIVLWPAGTVLRGPAWAPTAEPSAVAVPGDGRYSVTVAATDQAGNVETPPVTITWVVDTNPPSVAFRMWTLSDDVVSNGASMIDAPVTIEAVVGMPAFAVHNDSLAGTPVQATGMAIAVGCGDISGAICKLKAKLRRKVPRAVVVCGGASTGGSGDGNDGLPATALAAGEGTPLTPIDMSSPAVNGLVSAAHMVHPASPTYGVAHVEALLDGDYALEIVATDGVPNTRTLVVRWSVDTVAPAAPTIEHSLPQSLVTAATNLGVKVVFNQESSPHLAGARLLYHLDAAVGAEPRVVPAQYVTANEESGDLVVELALGDTVGSLTDNQALDDGGHRLTVWLVDAAGNEGASEDLRWSVLSDGPCTHFISGPEEKSGQANALFEFTAFQPRTSDLDCSAGESDRLPVPNATFQVQIEPPNWITVCAPNAPGTYIPPSAEAPLGKCTYSHPLPTVDRNYLMAIRAKNELGTPSVEPVSHSWRYEDCDKNFFAVVDDITGALACEPCPLGADCPGGLLQQVAVQAEEGWWSSDDSPALRFYKCPIEEACRGKEVTSNGTEVKAGCAKGYTGLLCALCADGYFRQFGKCAACPASREGVWAVTLSISALALVALAVLYAVRNALPIDVIGIIVSFCQVRPCVAANATLGGAAQASCLFACVSLCAFRLSRLPTRQ